MCYWLSEYSQELAQGMDVVKIFNSFDYNKVRNLGAHDYLGNRACMQTIGPLLWKLTSNSSSFNPDNILQDGLLVFTDVSRLLERLGAPAVRALPLSSI